MRLNRYISASGAASRRKGEIIIREGRVSVNGAVITDPAYNVDTGTDKVILDGMPLVLNPVRRYYVLNKPTGVIVSRGDTHGRVTVFDLLGDETKGVFPVGRLDAGTSGVLLLTDDGELAHRLMHPSYGMKKVYRAEVEGRITEVDVRRLSDGIVLDDGPAAPAQMTILESGETVSLVEVIMHQGRKHQVRRMLGKLKHRVRALERISFAGITSENIPLGAYRTLHKNEIARLKNESGWQSNFVLKKYQSRVT